MRTKFRIHKKKTPSEEKPRKGNAIAHNQHISGEG